MASGYTMPFGKYKGDPIEKIPDGALDHYLAWDELKADTRVKLEAEKARRGAGGARAGTATRDPESRPSPGRPRAQAGTQDPTAAWAERRRLCALDLIGQGEAALVKARPESRGIITETGEWLRKLASPVSPPPPAEDQASDVPF